MTHNDVWIQFRAMPYRVPAVLVATCYTCGKHLTAKYCNEITSLDEVVPLLLESLNGITCDSSEADNAPILPEDTSFTPRKDL